MRKNLGVESLEIRIIMDILGLRYSTVLVLLLALLPTGMTVCEDRPLEKDGRLVVIVTWGDIDNMPASNVFVEAHGYTHGLKSPPRASSLLKASQDGRYEASLQPGLYDVFVSDSSSVPRCRRVLVKAGEANYWTVKMEFDDVYLQK